jgi:hypothetical protein
MAVWAAVIAATLGTLGYLAGDLPAVLSGLAEVAAVAGLFALICAAEAHS